jgi:hypothetical protein
MDLIKDIAKLSWSVPIRSLVLPAIFVSFVGAIATKPSMAQSITPEAAPSCRCTRYESGSYQRTQFASEFRNPTDYS